MRWSFSRVNAWDGCKIAWHKNYIQKDRDQINNFFSSFGLFCEDLIQMADEEVIPYENLAEYYCDNFAEKVPEVSMYMSRGKMEPMDLKYFYFRAALHFFENFKGFSEPTLSFQEKVDLTLPNGDNFIGYIDRLSGTPEKYSIIDFKSKGQFKTKKELKRYARQLYVYSEHTINKYGVEPEMMYFHLFRSYGKTNKNGTRRDIVKIPWNKSDYEETLKWRDDTISEIKSVALGSDKWVPENKEPDFFFCQHLCSFSHNCKVHKEKNAEKTKEYEELFNLAEIK